MAEAQEHAQGQGVDLVITAWQAMTAEIAQLNHAFTTQGISSTVQKFDGNPKNFREWVKSIEKYAILVNMPDHRKKVHCIPNFRWRGIWFHSTVYTCQSR